MCWKQQCLDRCPTRLQRSDSRFLTLDRAVAGADPVSILAVLGRVRRDTSPNRHPSKARLKKQARQKSRLSREATEALRLWLTSNYAEAEHSPSALLACCELLALYGGQFPAEVVGGLWRATLAGALMQSESFLDASGTDDWQNELSPDTDISERWLKGGLLPFTCGLLFDDVKGAPRLSRKGRASLNDQLLQVTDQDGSPVGEVFDELPDFLSMWSDALMVSHLFDTPLWKGIAEKRFPKLLKRLAATVRLAEEVTGAPQGVLAAETLRIAVENQDVPAAAVWTESLGIPTGSRTQKSKSSGRKKSKSAAKPGKYSRANCPSWQSDETDTAVLRTSWAKNASVVTARFDQEPVHLDLAVKGVPLLSGPWQLELAEDGEYLELESAWECICWNSDADADYLELQLEFEGGPVLHRYVLLSRSQQFAILSDMISGSKSGRIDLSTSLPLAEGTVHEASGNSREQLLKNGSQTVRVYPLSFPQDRGIGTSGEIESGEVNGQNSLTFSKATESGTMCSPLVFDWSPKRRSAEVEWRQLTVTRAGEIDPAGAAAFRVQSGKLHLVLYRALAGTERYRTFLGYQAESETVIGHFTRSGVIEEILIVE